MSARGTKNTHGTTTFVLRKLFLENATQKTFALVLAMVLFVFVREDPQAERAVDVPLIVKPPDDRVRVGPLIEKVRLTVAGKYRRLRQFSADEVEPLTIRLTGTETELVFEPELFSLPEGVRVKSVRPVAMAVQFEEKLIRQVPVQAVADGDPEPGFRLLGIDVEPKEVLVEGAASAVRRIRAAKTEPLNLSGRNRTTTVRVPLVAPPPHVNFVGPARFAVTLTIEERHGTRVLQGLAVHVRGVGLDVGDFEISQAAVDVTLSGPLRELDKLDPGKLIAYVDATDIDNRTRVLHNRNVKFTPPSGLQLVELKPNRISVARRRAPPRARPDASAGDQQPAAPAPPDAGVKDSAETAQDDKGKAER